MRMENNPTRAMGREVFIGTAANLLAFSIIWLAAHAPHYLAENHGDTSP
jgi:hypothetical protein